MKKANWFIIGAALMLAVIGIVMIISSNKAEEKKISSPAPRVNKVLITPQGFTPAEITVKPGTKVIWTNDDTAIHQIYANPHPTGKSLPSLKSAILNNKQTYEYTFTKTGTYGYHDQLNPTTNGTINVKN